MIETQFAVPSAVEQKLLSLTGQEPRYAPREKINTFVLENFPALGKYVALRFLEWAQANEGWSVALPTGKTPEHFIKWVGHLLANWDTPEVTALLESHGIYPGRKPNLGSLHFVQIDEFYPINSWQKNSFYWYVNHYYLQGFGFDPDKAMLINPNSIGLEGDGLDEIWPEGRVDLSLRTRAAKTRLEEKQKRVLDAVDNFCTDYERRIRALGGIGFFLGGIGPDGHIGFNVRGSDHFSTTRLCDTNYETDAAAAGDLGGIEVSRDRLVITIGLHTITQNPSSTALIMAAGEAKAEIVRRAIESERDNQVPASALQSLQNASFYLTQGAARDLACRRHHGLISKGSPDADDMLNLITETALTNKLPLRVLDEEAVKSHFSGKWLLDNTNQSVSQMAQTAEDLYKRRLLGGLKVPTDEVFFHTAPHHDDIMLGYLPCLSEMIRERSNQHYFNYLTSGFNAVTNTFMIARLEAARAFLGTGEGDAFVRYELKDGNRDDEVRLYLDGLAADREAWCRQGESRRTLRCLYEIYEDVDRAALRERLRQLLTYLHEQYPGQKDEPKMQKFKGMTREWEADVLWGHYGYTSNHVIHSRLGFYKGELFTEEPEVNRDVLPVLELLKRIQPSVVTVALDPEGSGPDTHYKVLQAVSGALKLYVEETGRTDIRVWGYRNVWYRFQPGDANLMLPINLEGFAAMKRIFLDSFASQAKASFPSYAYDGPFSGLAADIQAEQYRNMRTLLGREFFDESQERRLREARGLVFLQELAPEAFFAKSRALKKAAENE